MHDSLVDQYLERFSDLIERGRTVLDAGCGDGIPVDAYLVERGRAVYGIDASEQRIMAARKNVPEGFYEVRDVLDLEEDEHCVDGVVSLDALLHIPRERYPALLRIFRSYMPNGGPILIAMNVSEGADFAGSAGGTHQAASHERSENADLIESADLVESAGLDLVLSREDGEGDKRYQVILARL